jgi:hypothetical protein
MLLTTHAICYILGSLQCFKLLVLRIKSYVIVSSTEMVLELLLLVGKLNSFLGLNN